ncbi:hypothetical protein BEP19_10655 [Ammoniphilus oxalaticus]|uniref:Restriction endonuclease n=1 Tax=Ammoniphilus oxalaticus TaxID=66863 RepID=A0A419SG00_9BACL|nr:MspI family type II restriction endonuclease [Ammoniphilus oxalaticus]RKD22708.1 hypothetical protein BEP19_10655 [Ammoniphilus oxalaticus]
MTDQFSRNFRGSKHQQLIQSLLDKLKQRGYIIHYSFFPKQQRFGYTDKNPQFYFPFLITFEDGEQWVIQSTTTYPRERMNGYQWNAFHIKQIDPNIKKAYVIYPDAAREDQVKSCIRYHQDIENKAIISALDGVISFADLYFLVEEKAFERFGVGARKDRQGKAFEKLLVDILEHPANLEIWNGEGDKDLGFNYPWFKKIISIYGAKAKEKLSFIEATDEIPDLPPKAGQRRGGKPKTDILVRLIFDSAPAETFTISSKRTSSDWVAIHQYSADTYIDVLGIAEDELKSALLELERVGAPTMIAPIYQQYITEQLPNYYERLAKWAYAGIGGEGDPATQMAEYFTIYKNETKELEISHLDDYIARILTEVEGQLGSPFRFTYTGTRGTNIQLRGKIL